MAKIEYRKEFFDRDYTAREAYRRVWKYARRYRLRLFVGIVCGMLTAGTLVPFFQIVQPALQHVESHDSAVVQPLSGTRDAPPAPAPAPAPVPVPAPAPAPASSEESVYVVVAGDCLWKIASRYYGNGSAFGRIADANGIRSPYIIRIGQKLVIPAK